MKYGKEIMTMLNEALYENQGNKSKDMRFELRYYQGLLITLIDHSPDSQKYVESLIRAINLDTVRKNT